MPTKFKKLSDYKKDQGLKYLLHKKLSITDEPRSLDVLHASELTKEDVEFCPRERAILLRDGDTRVPGRINTALNVTFQVGRWYENKVRNEWLREYALGDWECHNCGQIATYQTVPESCSNCSQPGMCMTYIEPRAYSPEFDTSCGIDFMLWKGGKLTPVEIKTIGRDQFEKLHGPLSEHRRRTQFYLDLLSHSTWMDYDVEINLDYAILLYVCKGFGFGDQYEGRQGVQDGKCSPFKEFRIKRGDGVGLKPVYDKALEVKRYKETGEVPKRICPNISCKRASKCPVRTTCFKESN